MDARTLAAPLVALVVGLAFGYVLRGPSDENQPERSTGPSTIELPRELEERITRIEQLLQRSSLAASAPPTRAPLDEPTTDHTELLAELRALIAEERAARTPQPTQSLSSEALRWQKLEVARRPMDTDALIALADEWHDGQGIPLRYFSHRTSDIVTEFGWPTRVTPHEGGVIRVVYAFKFQRPWRSHELNVIEFYLRDGSAPLLYVN